MLNAAGVPMKRGGDWYASTPIAMCVPDGKPDTYGQWHGTVNARHDRCLA